MDYKWKTLTVTTVGVFMACLDASIIVVGLPTVVEDLHTSLFLGIWIITGYQLTITILLVAIGRLTDIVGRVRLYNFGFAIFTLGSALCALSWSAEMLIAFRLIQGLGGAFLMANALAIVTDSFPTSELGTAIGINQMAINAGTITGYVLSGVMIGLFGWRSIFWLNVPIGLFGTVWCHMRLKELYTKVGEERFDYVGAATFSAALTILLFAMTANLRDLLIQVLLCVSGVLFVAFLLFERLVAEPFMDLSLFKIPTFAAGNISSFLHALAFWALAFELTLYLQLVRGLSPLQAGLALLPLDFMMILLGPVSGHLSDRYGSRILTAVGLGIASAALILFANLSLSSSFVFVTASLALAGAGMALFRSPNASSIMASVPPERRGIANGVRTTIFNTSGAISIPFAMALMTTVLPYTKLATIVNASLLTNIEDVQGLISAMSQSFYILAFLNGLAVVASLFREPRKM